MQNHIRTLLTTSDAGRRLGVGPSRIRQLALRGHLTAAVVTPSGQRLYDPAEVERLKAERGRTSQPAD